ncbi:MAG: glucose-6-phosphate dehydrogenase, partial [Dehalococcoidia bacterium]
MTTQVRSPEAQDIVILGATGDLARRKLLPSLFRLHTAGSLPQRGKILGVARGELTDEAFRAVARQAIEAAGGNLEEDDWLQFAARLQYVKLDAGLKSLAAASQQDRRLVYLAIPPSSFADAIHDLTEAGLSEGSSIVIEKPFGRDLASARRLNEVLQASFPEERIFRIDHYLGKETVQNILVLRFGNSIFERIWNREAIDHIEITVAEAIGVEERGGFYEDVGALRDVVQNHILQILATLTMEPPVSLDADAIRDEKVKLLKAVQPFKPTEAVRGQYQAATVGGERLSGYLEEADVAANSNTETFVALRVSIDNWRWSGVPIFLRTGKRLPRRATQVEIAFRDVPKCFFEGTSVESALPNRLVLEIQPEEKVSISFLSKVPGPQIAVKPVEMKFSFTDAFPPEPEEAYGRLLLDAMRGDHTLFVRQDGVERA